MFYFSSFKQKSKKLAVYFSITVMFGLSMCLLSCNANKVIVYEDIDGKAYSQGTTQLIKKSITEVFYDGYEEELKTAINQYFDDTNENIEKYLNWYFGFFHGVEKKLSNIVEFFTDTDLFSDLEVEKIIKGINKKLLPKKSLSYTLGVPLLRRQKALNKKVISILKKNEIKISNHNTYNSSLKTTLKKIYINSSNHTIVPSTDLNTDGVDPEYFSSHIFKSDPSENIVNLFLVQTVNFANAAENAQNEQDFNDYMIEGITEETLKFGAKKLLGAVTKLSGPMGFLFDLSSDIGFEKQHQQEAFKTVMDNTVENAREFYLNSI